MNGIKERDEAASENESFFTVSYVSGISELFGNLVKKHNFNLSFAITNSLQKYIKIGKDQLSLDSSCETVYKINCQDCETSYVGQTKRLLKIGVNEHFRDIKKSSGFLSVLSDCRLTLEHEFVWQGVRILDREAS